MTMKPDPTFHASPKLAMEAPQENFACILLLSPDFSKPDALAVIDVKPGSPTFSQIVHTVTMPRPMAGVVAFAPEAAMPAKFGMLADDRQPVAMMQWVAATRSLSPTSSTQRFSASSKMAECHPRIELNVAAQLEAVGDVVGVTQDLRLRRIALGPNPLLLQLLRELVRILHALNVAACARVAVPIPGATDAASGLEDTHGKAHPA